MAAPAKHAKSSNPECGSAVEQSRLIARHVLHGPGIQAIADEYHEKSRYDDVAPLDQAAGQLVAAVQAGDHGEQNAGGYKADGGEQGGRQIGNRNLGEDERGAPYQVHGTQAENKLRGVARVVQT